MSGEELARRKAEAEACIRAVVHGLGEECGDETEYLWALGGLILGAGLALWLLASLGKAPGLSAPGINSGLSAVGAYAGGGMLAGLLLLFLPPALCSLGGYILACRKNRARAVAAADEALAGLRRLRLQLQEHEILFSGELRLLDLLIWSMSEGAKAHRPSDLPDSGPSLPERALS